ncbi:MAG TPA: hypothetical protein VJ917_11540 [Saprospiraceae bacterium]|nr:hypothetical protein [Saprospiraceae bacterium]
MRKFLVFIFVATIIQACVPSINPLYKAEDLIFKEFLLGKWEGGSETWTFHSTDQEKYMLDHFDGENGGSYTAHLLELEGKYYLDITAKEIEACDYMQKLTAFDVHTFARVDYEGEKMVIRLMSYENLDDGLKDGTLHIGHIRNSEDELLLTAPTNALQTFVTEHPELFDVDLELNKSSE